ncbi:MAG: hypothetical protein Q8P07_00275 [bacterium]|nr:hypothetical protein [bacterium]
MLMEVSICRRTPRSGLNKTKSFAIMEVCDLEKTKKELDWLFGLFRERNYELVRSNWQFPQNPEVVFAKPISKDPRWENWKDVWVIRLVPYDSKEAIEKYISSALIK